MIRFAVIVILVIGFLVFSIPLLIAEHNIGKKDPQKRDRQSLAIIKRVFWLLLKVTGTKVTVRGLENIPKDQAVLYVGNHRSYFDILVGYVAVPGLTGFVAKKEMEKCPLLSDWMRNVHCLFLDRENIKEGLKTILAGVEKVKQGISIWIFPEGTRNRADDVSELLPFKEGSLKIAEKSGCPVVPVALTGTAEIFEKQFPFIRTSHVTIEFGKPFIIKELEPEERKFSGAYTRDRILEMLIREKEQREHS